MFHSTRRACPPPRGSSPASQWGYNTIWNIEIITFLDLFLSTLTFDFTQEIVLLQQSNPDSQHRLDNLLHVPLLVSHPNHVKIIPLNNGGSGLWQSSWSTVHFQCHPDLKPLLTKTTGKRNIQELSMSRTLFQLRTEVIRKPWGVTDNWRLILTMQNHDYLLVQDVAAHHLEDPVQLASVVNTQAIQPW